MLTGFVTIDGRYVGTVEANLVSEAPELDAYAPSGPLEQEDSSPRLGHAKGFFPGQSKGGSDRHGTRLGHAKGFFPKEGAKSGAKEGHSQAEQVSGGDYGQTGGRSEANYLGSARARAAGIDAAPGEDLTTVQTRVGPITVNKSAAEDMTGAVNDLVAAGAPVGHIGSYANRNIAGSGRKSQHAYGGAMDLFNQTGRGVISREGMNWIRNNPEKWQEIKQKHNLVGGEEFGDIGHVEWGGPGYGARHYGKSSAPTNAPSATQTPGGKNVKGSWFDDTSTATGLSAATTPGIALPSREGLGKMHEVTGPNGKTVLLPQIDIGPAKWTGRGIDISKGALSKLGYTTKDFPTDSSFTHKPAEPEKKIDTSTEPM